MQRGTQHLFFLLDAFLHFLVIDIIDMVSSYTIHPVLNLI